MSYGLDLTEVRYETDHAGNRLKATIPYTMFSALTEFWVAARRAQTAKVEADTRPGQYKGSLQAVQVPTPDEPAASRPPDILTANTPHDRHWQSLIARMPVEPPAEQAAADPPPPDDSPEATSPPAAKPTTRRVFYREFVDAPPAEIAERIAGGAYFTRAWREHRGLTLADAADLFGRDKTTIIFHESGKSTPSRITLEKLAQIYDCPLGQITPKPGSDDSPFYGKPVQAAPVEVEAKPVQRRTVREPRSPADTDYPDAVLAHMMAGKSPMLAWRLYRNMTLKALAEAYGNTSSNVKTMEQHAWLRRPSIDRLCAVFHCKPDQLLRPAGMPGAHGQEPAAPESDAPAPHVVKLEPRKLADEPTAAAASMMESAFMQATVTDGATRDSREGKERDRARDGRLAKMQAELARL